jgi:capsular polysaccharide transport system permease protein
VRVLDLFIARLLLEVAGASISLLTLATLFVAADLMPLPDDLLKMIIGWVLLAWFSMCMGLIVGSLVAVSEAMDRVWHVVSYLFLPLSGAFFMVDWIPRYLRELALLIPTVDCIEILRAGYFGANLRTHYDLPYLLSVNTVLTFVALAAIRRVSMTVEGE